MLILIIANWIVIGLVGTAMVYALALAVYDLGADVKRSRALQANSDLYQQLLLDAQRQISFWKKFWYEDQKKENLLQGYKKVILNLTDKLRRKES